MRRHASEDEVQEALCIERGVEFAVGRRVVLSRVERDRLAEVVEYLRLYGNTVYASYVNAVVRKYDEAS